MNTPPSMAGLPFTEHWQHRSKSKLIFNNLCTTRGKQEVTIIRRTCSACLAGLTVSWQFLCVYLPYCVHAENDVCYYMYGYRKVGGVAQSC